MYNHRTEKTRVDVVDLDPYGTAAPFIDGAVQCVNDGGKSTKMGLTQRIHFGTSQDSCVSHAQTCQFWRQQIIMKNGACLVPHATDEH